jgi:hypothetical protein
VLPYQIQVPEECPTGFILLNLLRPPDVYARHPLQTLQCYLDYVELAQTATKNASLHTQKPETNRNITTQLFKEFWNKKQIILICNWVVALDLQKT